MTWQVRSWLGGDLTGPTGHGAAFVVIDAATIQPDLPARVEALVDEVHAAPRADGVERLYVPGEMEWERYDRALRSGVELPSDVVHSLAEAAGLVGLDLADFGLGDSGLADSGLADSGLADSRLDAVDRPAGGGGAHA